MSSYLDSLVIKSQQKPCSQVFLVEQNFCKINQTVYKCNYFLFTDIIFLGYQMVRHIFDCLRVMFACVNVWLICGYVLCGPKHYYAVVSYMQRFKDLCGPWGAESVAEKKPPSCPLNFCLYPDVSLWHRGVKLTVTVIARFVGRTVSVPSFCLARPHWTAVPLFLHLYPPSLLFCQGMQVIQLAMKGQFLGQPWNGIILLLWLRRWLNYALP